MGSASEQEYSIGSGIGSKSAVHACETVKFQLFCRRLARSPCSHQRERSSHLRGCVRRRLSNSTVAEGESTYGVPKTIHNQIM